ncbi:MAG: hypothetical protein AAF721_37420 [Myxococcota bacterium]
MKVAWIAWQTDPVTEATGITFDRTPAGTIAAPPGRVRVCAYHVDWEERPVCYVDVNSVDEATAIAAAAPESLNPYNADYVVAYDERGAICVQRPW